MLVTAIDRRLPTIDMITAIVDGTVERLQAVFLTTFKLQAYLKYTAKLIGIRRW